MAAQPAPHATPAALPEELLRAFSQLPIVRSFPRNTVILSEGDRTDSLYVVLSGKVKFYISEASGREVVLGTAGPGEYFGEMVLDEGPRSASVLTLEPSRFAVVSHGEMRTALAAHPDFALHVIVKLISRVRALTENVRSLALLDVYGRVARLLLDLAVEQDGKWVVAERLTQREIASRVGASREMVSRVFRELGDGGYISLRGRRIEINRKPPAGW
jgi:CRP/FNR family transcriptional regulator, cyclic AMP receptor protein